MKKKLRTALQLELEELIALYRNKGYKDEYIIATFKKVFEDIRFPEPELKGDLDT